VPVPWVCRAAGLCVRLQCGEDEDCLGMLAIVRAADALWAAASPEARAALRGAAGAALQPVAFSRWGPLPDGRLGWVPAAATGARTPAVVAAMCRS